MSRALFPDERASTIFSRDFILVCLASLAFFGSFYLLLPVLPLYVVAIGGTEAEVGLIIGFFTLAAVVLRPFIGRGVDEHGRRVFLIFGAAVFVVSSLLYNFTNTVPLLLLLRLVHGIGIATFFTAASALAADLAPADRRGEAMGLFGTAGNIAMAIGPAIGIILLQQRGFLWVFLAAAVAALACLALASLVRDRPRRVSVALNARGPLFSRQAVFPAVLAFFGTITYGAVASFLPLYATQQGVSNPGLFFTVYAAALISVRIAAGKISDRFGRAVVIGPGFLLSAAAMVVLVLAHSEALLALAAVLYGFGFGAVHPTLMAMVTDRAIPAERGAAMGTLGGSIDLGIAVGSFLLGVVLQYWGFSTMFLVAAVSPLIGFVLLLLSVSRSARASELAVLPIKGEGE